MEEDFFDGEYDPMKFIDDDVEQNKELFQNVIFGPS